LATCKTRLNLPPPLLFQPTDLHDDSDVNSIRKVLNVLSFLRGDTDFIKPEDEDDGEEETAPVKPEPVKPAPQVAPKVEPKPTPAPASQRRTSASTPAEPINQRRTSASTPSDSKLETDWYLHDKKSAYVDIQDELLSVILSTTNSELSVDSKRKLLRKLQTQISFVEDKILSSNDDQLRTLAHSMGLGESTNDIPKSKGRDWLVEFILKYGRAH